MSDVRRFGILNIDKPAGITSRRVVDHVAKLVRPEKAGHAGTLDPLATGVLVVCVGKATRLIEAVQEQPKSYHATFVFGRQSDTDDVTGTVTDVAVGGARFSARRSSIICRRSSAASSRCRRRFPRCTSPANALRAGPDRPGRRADVANG